MNDAQVYVLYALDEDTRALLLIEPLAMRFGRPSHEARPEWLIEARDVHTGHARTLRMSAVLNWSPRIAVVSNPERTP